MKDGNRISSASRACTESVTQNLKKIYNVRRMQNKWIKSIVGQNKHKNSMPTPSLSINIDCVKIGENESTLLRLRFGNDGLSLRTKDKKFLVRFGPFILFWFLTSAMSFLTGSVVRKQLGTHHANSPEI